MKVIRSLVLQLICLGYLVAGQNTTTRPATTSLGFNSTTNVTVVLAPTPTPTPTPTSISLSNLTTTVGGSSNSSSNSTTTPTGPHLNTKLDATFGILGGLLVVSGIPTAFYGSRNRWASFFINGVWVGAMVVGLLILKFGVVGATKDPSSTTRGLFLFASLAAGIITGGVSIVFWKGAQHLCAAMGGFCVGVFLLCVRSDCLIRPIGLRFILVVGLAAIAFVFSTFSKLTPLAVMLATSALGSTTIVLGVDCFTASNLKEFYVYAVGLRALFPQFSGHFPQTQGIQIELGVMGALFLSSAAYQYRFHDLIVSKSKELRQADRARSEEEEAANGRSKGINNEQLTAWEEKWGSGASRSPMSTSALLETFPSRMSSVDSSPLQLMDRSDSPFAANRSRTSSGLTLAPRNSSIELPPIDFNSTPGGTPPTPYETPGSRPVDWEGYFAKRKVTSPIASPPLTGRQPPLQRQSFSSTNLDQDNTPIASLPSFSRPPPANRSPSLPARPSSLALVIPAPAANVGGDNRRNTMIDLSTPSAGLTDRPARQRSSTAERVVVGPRVSTTVPVAAPAPPPVAQVMDYAQLDAKHRKRISQLQAPATNGIKSEAELAAAKEAFEARQRREAAEQKQKERDRNRSSQRISSMGSISGLLNKVTSSPTSSPDIPSSSTFGPGSRPIARQGSLGALLEESPEKPSVTQRRESRRVDGLSRVAAWKEQETSPVLGAAQEAPPKPAGKHSWLGY